MPKIELYVKFCFPLAIKSAQHAGQHDLWARMVQDALTETLYTASLAELGCSISASDVSITLRIAGFHAKASFLLRSVLDVMFDPDRCLSPDILSRQREILERVYSNEYLKAQHAARTHRLLALKPSKYSAKAKCAIVINPVLVNLDSMRLHCKWALNSMTADILAHGNLSVSKVSLIKSLLCQFKDDKRINMSAECRPTQPIVRLPASPYCAVLSVIPDNPTERNVCVEVYYQLHEYELLGVTRLDLLEQVLTEPFFDNLRTKQQVCAQLTKIILQY